MKLYVCVLYYCRCDSKRIKNAALSFLPIIGWMKIYKFRQWLLNDIISGVSTGLVAVLQGSILFFFSTSLLRTRSEMFQLSGKEGDITNFPFSPITNTTKTSIQKHTDIGMSHTGMSLPLDELLVWKTPNIASYPF